MELWYTPNAGATNERGFTALPNGYRDIYTGMFDGLNGSGDWWSSTETISTKAYLRVITAQYADLDNFEHFKSVGVYVRCIKD